MSRRDYASSDLKIFIYLFFTRSCHHLGKVQAYALTCYCAIYDETCGCVRGLLMYQHVLKHRRLFTHNTEKCLRNSKGVAIVLQSKQIIPRERLRQESIFYSGQQKPTCVACVGPPHGHYLKACFRHVAKLGHVGWSNQPVMRTIGKTNTIEKDSKATRQNI